MRTVLSSLLLVLFCVTILCRAETNPSWVTPIAPFRIADNLYYVGSEELASSRYRDWLALGYTDVFRSLHPGETGQFTYWDYFRLAFEHNRGIRIDHFLVSPSLAPRIRSCEIDRTPRSEQKPSDHTPILIELD